jgi:hypothetical protein
VEQVKMAMEALTLSIAEKARVDFAYMSKLTGMTEDELKDGSVLSFPMMTSDIHLHDHQKNAIVHAMFGGNTYITFLLFWQLSGVAFIPVVIVVVTDVIMLEEVVDVSLILLPQMLIVATVLPSGEIIVFVSLNLFLSIIPTHFIILKQTVFSLIRGL